MNKKIPMPHIELAVNLMQNEIRELKEKNKQLREVLEKLLDQTNCHSTQCKRKYWDDYAAGLNSLCICAVDEAKALIKEK